MSIVRCLKCADAPILQVASHHPFDGTCPSCKSKVFGFQTMQKLFGDYTGQRIIEIVESKISEPGGPCPICPNSMLLIQPWQHHPRREAYGNLKPVLQHWSVDQRSMPIEFCVDCLLFRMPAAVASNLPSPHGSALHPELSVGLTPMGETPIQAILSIPKVEIAESDINTNASPFTRAQHNESKQGESTLVTWILALACVGIYFLTKKNVPHEMVFTPSEFTEHPNLSIISSIFVHGDGAHLTGNMLFFLIFSRDVEKRLSTAQYLYLFFVSGIIGKLCYWAADPHNPIGAIGASGAISGIILYFTLCYPNAQISNYFPIIQRRYTGEYFQWVQIKTSASLFTAFYILSEVYYAMTQHHSHVNHLAHLGGALGGFVCWWWNRSSES